MNNKKLGTAFEKKVCEKLGRKGYWVHFIVPDARGAQPFDIVAVKNGNPVAIDCKTCASDVFYISRLEQNQIMAFEKWMRCGNNCPVIVIDYKGEMRCVEYVDLKEQGKIILGGKGYEKIQNSKFDFSVSFDDYFDGV